MNIYTYDEETKEYLMTLEADADPEETLKQGVFVPLLPAHSTLQEPPAYDIVCQIPVYENGEWVIYPDYRKNYYKADSSLNIYEIETIGNQKGFYVVDKSVAEDIKTNPDRYKIFEDKVVKKSNEEYETEQAEKARKTRVAEIKSELNALDAETVRPLRAEIAGTATDEDIQKLKDIEEQAVALRVELQNLNL